MLWFYALKEHQKWIFLRFGLISAIPWFLGNFWILDFFSKKTYHNTQFYVNVLHNIIKKETFKKCSLYTVLNGEAQKTRDFS